MRFPSDVPTLSDGVATIRAHRPEDAPAVLEQCLDPVSRQWTTVPLDYTRADADRFVRDIAPGAWRTEAELLFAVEALDTSLTTADEPDGVRRAAGLSPAGRGGWSGRLVGTAVTHRPRHYPTRLPVGECTER